MLRSRLRRFQLASVSLTCLVMILLGCNEAGAQVPSRTDEHAVVPTRPLPASPLAPSAVLSNIPTSEAKGHIGKTNTVCGLVTGGRFLESAKGKPTFLNFERPFPDHTFTVVIFELDRAKFKSPPESLFDGKTVCVTGPIIDYKGKPEIVVRDPSHMVIQEATPTMATGMSPNANQSPAAATSGTTSKSSKKPTTSIHEP